MRPPSATPAALARDFTLATAGEAFVDNPYPTYAALRAHAPVQPARDDQNERSESLALPVSCPGMTSNRYANACVRLIERWMRLESSGDES